MLAHNDGVELGARQEREQDGNTGQIGDPFVRGDAEQIAAKAADDDLNQSH
jgi:hypothetical protein